MTTLEKIVKGAKEIKKNYPKKYAKWTDYIKESSQKLKGTFAKKKTKLGATKKIKMKKKPIKYNDTAQRESDLIRKEIKSKKFIMPHGYEVRRSKLNGNSIGNINNLYITELNNINKEIENAKQNINSLKTLKRNNLKGFKLGFKQELLDKYINRTKYLKKQLIQIKKQIK